MNRVLQNKKQLLVLLFAMLTSAIGLRANPVDMNTAREVGFKFMNANAKTPMRGIDDLQLVTTYSISRGDVAFYIFNTSNSFVIVSADDCATPILGYSNEGRFDMENIPIQLQDYLQSFVEQIEYGIENYLETDEQTARQWELVRTVGRLTDNRSEEVVEPLLTTTWNQRYPYNMFVPSGCPTGCVATAMAQIMKYWEWPMQGTGEHSYQWNGQTLSANFGETIYDWDNMLDNYGNSTQEQMEAVATLMWHCGVSVNMNYASGVSLAYLNPSSLINYFNYSDDLHQENRQDDESWMSLLKTDLDLGRPVYYVGNYSNYNESHAFVCDGYDANDRFHFNYGWGGNSDGYYALNAIHYFENNYAIFNIHPNASITRQVTASASPSDGGIVAGAGIYDIGSICTMTATANEGYAFMYWTEDGEVVSTQAEYSFCVRKDRDLVAHFGMPFHIEVEITPEEGGSVNGTGEYDYGSTCTLTATTNEGYDFICWRKANGNVASTASTYSFTVTEATTLTAVFAVSGGEQIPFADLNVKALCVANWDTDGDGELSYSEAAAVTDLGRVFYAKSTITSFEELQYFTGLTTIGNYAFYHCNNLSGTLCIPNSVTMIGNGAFFCCSGFTGSLTIPDSVTAIGDDAFYDCSGFTGSLNIPNSVTIIGSCAFENCSGFTGSLTIGNSVTEIGLQAFQNCNGFTGSLTIGNSVVEIGISAFRNCNGFTGGLTLGNSVTIIGENAFYDCIGFTGSLIIPNSVTDIGAAAFYNCSGFTGSLTIGNSVTTIGGSAFMRCSGFTGDLIIPDSVITIGYFAFQHCSGFTGNLIIGNSVTTIGGRVFVGCNGFTGSLTLGNSMTTIGNAAFLGCNSFTGNLVIPDSVISIGNYAFQGCSGFTGNLTIPDSVISIGNYAFQGCSGFTGNLTIGNSVTTIGYNAFSGCNGFTGSLAIGNSVTTIGNYTFSGCSGFTGDLVIPNSVTTIGQSAFSGCSSFNGNLIIPNSVTSIDDYAFNNCSGFTGNLAISNSVTSIGSYAFYGCSSFNGNLIIPNSVTLISNSAFQNCSSLTSVTIGNSATSISDYAFQNCSGLTSVTIGTSVTSIGRYAFQNCSGLTSLIVLAEMSPVLNFYSFNGCPQSILVYVPCGSVEAYTSVNWGGFNNFLGMCGGTVTVVADSEERGTVTGGGSYEAGQACTVMATANDGYVFTVWTRDGIDVSNSDEYTFYVTDDMTLVAHFVPEGNIVFTDVNVKNICVSHWDTNGDGELSYAEAAAVTSLGLVFRNNTEIISFEELQYFINLSLIDDYAFYNCSGLTGSLIIPNTVTSIGNYAFFGCSGFTNPLIIPNSVTSIGQRAFSNCCGFTGDLTIPNSVTEIGNHAFYQCRGFTGSLTIGDSLTKISNSAFQGCSGFTGSLTIGNSVTLIGYDAFNGCSGFTGSLTIGNAVTTIGNEAFMGCSGFTGSLTIPNSVTMIGGWAFHGCTGFTGSLTIGNAVTTIGNAAFQDCSGFTGSLTIPDSVISIGNYAFCDCTGFTGNLTIGNSVTTIGDCAFLLCSGFVGSLTIPDSVTTIGDDAFFYCIGFTGSLTLGNSVISIGNYAFCYCTGFTGDLTIGNSVTTIREYAFFNCNGFTSMNVLSETPLVLSYYSFYNFPKSILVYVPCGSLAVYQSAAYWNEFTNIQELCSQTQTIELSQGWNWFSTYIDITLDDLKATLVEAVPGTNISIKSKTQNTAYNPGTNQWNGSLTFLDVAQMYMIKVGTDCQITLTGTPINPSECSITINNGYNWIGFPLNESMSVSEAFSGFAIEGDIIKSRNSYSVFNGTSWRGNLDTLEPGKGYIYNSKANEVRTFVFPHNGRK